MDPNSLQSSNSFKDIMTGRNSSSEADQITSLASSDSMTTSLPMRAPRDLTRQDEVVVAYLRTKSKVFEQLDDTRRRLSHATPRIFPMLID